VRLGRDWVEPTGYWIRRPERRAIRRATATVVRQVRVSTDPHILFGLGLTLIHTFCLSRTVAPAGSTTRNRARCGQRGLQAWRVGGGGGRIHARATGKKEIYMYI